MTWPVKCKHCGEPMAEVPYGAGTRWLHVDIRHPTWLDLMYLGCRSGYSAEPRDERKS